MTRPPLTTAARARILVDFLKTEAGSGLLLVTAALVAVVWANSPAGGVYADALGIQLGPFDLQHWINDAAMSVFFLVVGMEIKRELVDGELADLRQAVLPIVGAIGGMVVPAVVYTVLVGGGDASGGWGIPMATDIAIVAGVIALLGRRAPGWLRLFLLALAIVDDIGAIVVIAVFYSSGVSAGWLAAAVGTVLAALAARRWTPVPWPVVCVVLGVACWIALHQAHIHPTLAGVAFGLLTPTKDDDTLEHMEHAIHPWSALVIVPIFALANAGVRIPAHRLDDAFTTRVTWAVIVGLVLGKSVGIAGATLLAVRLRAGVLPAGITRRHVVGGAALGGIGFTVSLFITDLAFTSESLARDARLGVMAGSLVAAITGTLILGKPPMPDEQP